MPKRYFSVRDARDATDAGGKAGEAPEVLEGKSFAILAYLSILCIIPLILKKGNPFVLTHSKQGLVIFLGQVAVLIVSIVLGQWALRLGMFVLLVFAFIGIIAVLQGREVKLPVISEIAGKITM
jgi:fumarate reductase subunit D